MGSSLIAQGDELGALCPPRGVGKGGWEGDARGRIYGDICLCIADSLCYTAETNTFVKQLYSNKDVNRGSPSGAVVENLPANAGDTGSSPGLGRSHMPRSNQAREPQLLSLRVWSLCSATRQAAIMRGPRTAMKSGPRLPQLEKALAQKRRPNTAINK